MGSGGRDAATQEGSERLRRSVPGAARSDHRPGAKDYLYAQEQSRADTQRARRRAVRAEFVECNSSSSGPAVQKLERFANGLNREGFPNQQRSDSSCMLVKE